MNENEIIKSLVPNKAIKRKATQMVFKTSLLTLSLFALALIGSNALAETNTVNSATKKKATTSKEAKSAKKRVKTRLKAKKMSKIMKKRFKKNKKLRKVSRNAMGGQNQRECRRLYRRFANSYNTCMDQSDSKTQCGGCGSASDTVTEAKNKGCSLNHLDGMIKDVGSQSRKLGCDTLEAGPTTAPQTEAELGN